MAFSIGVQMTGYQFLEVFYGFWRVQKQVLSGAQENKNPLNSSGFCVLIWAVNSS
jgi:hypothetical protein